MLTLKPGAVVFNRATRVWEQNVQVTNKSCQNLTNMAIVLESLAAGWTLQNGDGTRNGAPYRLLLPINSLVTYTITLRFNRTGTTALRYSPKFLGDPVAP